MRLRLYPLTPCSDDDNDLAEYDLEHYDDEVDDAAGDTMAMFGNANNLVFHENEDDNLYVHHDIMLPAIPLAVEWLDLPVGKSAGSSNGKGNTVAIGTMDPDIELWNLDVVDSMYPDAVLGQGSEDAADKPKKK